LHAAYSISLMISVNISSNRIHIFRYLWMLILAVATSAVTIEASTSSGVWKKSHLFLLSKKAFKPSKKPTFVSIDI
jgi:hypothetical protein